MFEIGFWTAPNYHCLHKTKINTELWSAGSGKIIKLLGNWEKVVKWTLNTSYSNGQERGYTVNCSAPRDGNQPGGRLPVLGWEGYLIFYFFIFYGREGYFKDTMSAKPLKKFQTKPSRFKKIFQFLWTIKSMPLFFKYRW